MGEYDKQLRVHTTTDNELNGLVISCVDAYIPGCTNVLHSIYLTRPDKLLDDTTNIVCIIHKNTGVQKVFAVNDATVKLPFTSMDCMKYYLFEVRTLAPPAKKIKK